MPRDRYTVRLPPDHAEQLELWAYEKGFDVESLGALLLCHALETYEETGTFKGLTSRTSRNELKDRLARRLTGGVYGGADDLDDGIPF